VVLPLWWLAVLAVAGVIHRFGCFLGSGSRANRMMRVPIGLLVVLIVFAACSSSERPLVVDEGSVAQSNIGLLILASEYPNGQFEPSYSEGGRSRYPDAECVVIVHDVLGILPGECPMAERRIFFESDISSGVFGYLAYWNDSDAHDALSLFNVRARGLEVESMVVQRDYLTDITRVSLGPATDAISYIYLLSDEGAVHLAFIRVGQVLYYVVERSGGPVRDRRLAGVTWPEDYDSIRQAQGYSYAELYLTPIRTNSSVVLLR
jgi:hypothetical protein